MTPNQAAIIEAIHELFDGRISPSISEICEHTGLGRSRVHAALLKLRADGLVTWTPRRPRSLTLIENAVSPATLEQMPIVALRRTAAIIAGILAQRGGGICRSDGLPEHRRSASPAGEGLR